MIYCVEDDSSIREIEIYTLHSIGMDAMGFANSSDFFTAVSKERPELILLDIMLPDEDGISILRKLKKNPDTSSIPVIMASAKGTEYDKVTGLDSGADDYLAKPFGMMEMVSRIRAVLRRAQKPAMHTMERDGITIIPEAHKVFVNKEPVVLTLKEYDLLILFMSHPGIVYTRDKLLNEIWDTDFNGESRTVDVHIRTLRQKLGEAGSQIETVRGVGYRFQERSS